MMDTTDRREPVLRSFVQLACLGFVLTIGQGCDTSRTPVTPDPSEPQLAAIHGVVLTAGSPVSGAQIVLDGPGITRSVTTGTDGTFRFAELPPGLYVMRVSNGTCTSTTADMEAGETVTTSIDCASPPLTTTLRGTVTVGETPVGGVQVTLMGATFSTGAEVERAVVTDATGRFTFVQVGEGAYTLTAQASDLACETTAVHVQDARQPATANISCAEEISGGTTPPPMDKAGKIAFERNGRIMILDLDTSNLFHFVDGLAPSWSPDGRQIVFQRPGCPDRSLPPYSDCDDVWKVNADGSGLSPITSYEWVLDYDPVWSPDGSKVAFIRFVHGIDDTYLVIANADPPPALWREQVASSWWPISRPTWSADGTRIAFTCQGPPPRWEFDICMVSSNGNIGYSGSGQRPVEKITNDTWTNSEPAWSPDGARIAFATDRETPGRTYIALIRPDGGGFERLVLGHRPAWSPDGRRIVFVGGVDAPAGLYIVNADGSGLTRITDNPADTAPSWGR